MAFKSIYLFFKLSDSIIFPTQLVLFYVYSLGLTIFSKSTSPQMLCIIHNYGRIFFKQNNIWVIYVGPHNTKQMHLNAPKFQNGTITSEQRANVLHEYGLYFEK